MPAVLYGLSADTWFNLAYVALTALFGVLVFVHRRRPLALLAASWLGRSQLLFLALLWIMVVGNFERALVAFAPQRLVTEGVIFLNAALCTAGIFVSAPTSAGPVLVRELNWGRLLPKTMGIGLVAAAMTVAAEWAVVRGIYGNQQAGYAARHIRFGPDATVYDKPKRGAPHP